MAEIIKGDGAVTLINEGSSSIVTIMGLQNFESIAVNTKANVKETKDSKNVEKTKPWSKWGDNDDWPDKLVVTLGKLGVAKSALDLNSDLHYGSGIQWMKESVDETAGTLKHIVSNPDGWRLFAAKSGFSKALSDAINSIDTFGLAAIRFVLNVNDNVYRMSCLDTPSVRLGFRNNQGKIEKIYYQYDIAEVSTDDEAVKYQVYDEDNHEDFIKKNKQFVVLLRSRTWGRFYYPEPNYYATFTNGWADIAIEVPKLIKHIYKNQATLKYHIKIPISVFEAKYKCWGEKTEEEQLKLFADYKTEMESVISKAEASGSSVVSVYKDTYDKIEITDIKSSLDTNKDLPNNTAANSEILFAIGIDPSLLGLNMPGGKDLNGGGGSQRRESLKIKQATLTRERLLTLDLAYIVAKLNNYSTDLYPMYIDIDVSQTLDENPTGKKTTVGG